MYGRTADDKENEPYIVDVEPLSIWRPGRSRDKLLLERLENYIDVCLSHIEEIGGGTRLTRARRKLQEMESYVK